YGTGPPTAAPRRWRWYTWRSNRATRCGPSPGHVRLLPDAAAQARLPGAADRGLPARRPAGAGPRAVRGRGELAGRGPAGADAHAARAPAGAAGRGPAAGTGREQGECLPAVPAVRMQQCVPRTRPGGRTRVRADPDDPEVSGGESDAGDEL